ncbi:hypothetical protein [Xanthomonas phaseoli]|uniref:hypothetical protein n=1 Tax=Xanthomonas phaseoli TaxID=1985254 RepID=UPI0002FFC880|nr:hypothetical protein [Xanthomonas phaseoli]
MGQVGVKPLIDGLNYGRHLPERAAFLPPLAVHLHAEREKALPSRIVVGPRFIFGTK